MEKSSKKKHDRLFSVWRLRWPFVAGAVVITGGVMSFGYIALWGFHMNGKNAIVMLGMIIPMLIVYLVALKLILSGVEKRMSRLVDGIHEVAEGNFEYRIDLKGAEEYRQVYQEFNQMASELNRTRQEMESFVNEFAHEFKTPIASINGFAELLYETGEGIEDEERMEYLQIISEQSGRLCDLSQNTLLLSKVNAMQIVSDKEEYDICEQIRKCVILLSKSIDEKKLDVDIPEDYRLLFYGNQELLEHIWINLISNAVKYTRPGGNIIVRFKEEGDSISVSIADNGIGMDEETAGRVFDKYYQHDTVSANGGNGIGLAIVKRISELCGGDVSVISSPGSGSTFTVKLPK